MIFYSTHPPPIYFTLSEKKTGTKAVTGAVPLKKVHYCTQRLHIGSLVVHIAPKIFILTPKMSILAPKMYILETKCTY